MKRIVTALLGIVAATSVYAQSNPIPNLYRDASRIYLDSKLVNGGGAEWLMAKSSDVKDYAETISRPGYAAEGWMPAIVPGTVLNTLVYNNVYPEPYYGLNNKLESGLIPDVALVGREFYTSWFRCEFDIPKEFEGKYIWLQLDGINYRAEVWLNGHLLNFMSGMFREAYVNITDFAKAGERAALAVKVYPVDVPGRKMPKRWNGAPGEWQNGGDGNIGHCTTMLMTAGWDFSFNDGIRDRNTGIWKSISLYSTGPAVLRHPFVKSTLNAPQYDLAEESVSVEITNLIEGPATYEIRGEIEGEGITFSKVVDMNLYETREVGFSAADFPQLKIANPRLWWPLFKGPQNLYNLKIEVYHDGKLSSETRTRFGIREIVSDCNTPDGSRQFYVNGHRIFIRGTNWIPEAMLRGNDARTYAELRYTRQSGVNFIRFWGGGITESDYFFQLCDEFGLMIWEEFWMTGDTRMPNDIPMYLANVEATVKRIRNHPSLAYYVCSNEGAEAPGIKDLIFKLDGTRGYQRQSEVEGIHDGSPYKQVNPMQHYENTASARGSRIDGFNPEYGAPTIPTVETLREIMDEKDLWPINKEVWDYHDGGGFHLMTTMYKDLTDNYGPSSTLEEFVARGQMLGAMNSKSIWECWNYNKYGYGDRYAAGTLFWYHNCPVPQVCARMWDYSLEPTASLYHTQNALEPLHAQFDYIKNTVSVYNEYYEAFPGYSVVAELYDINSRKVWNRTAKVDIPADGVVNDVFAIEFPNNISKLHFIKLRLVDGKGRQVADTFYWRSTDKYEGKETLTGPTSSGFEDVALLPKVSLKSKYRSYEENGRHFINVEVANTGRSLAFFVQLQLLDESAKPVRPSFYSDNFFSLLPGERKSIVIETALEDMPSAATFVVGGWNVNPRKFTVTTAK
ncbi:MAG: glycoside hydrolase family 2 [Bacteroidales bacterium]|nr:glycoside hydrolase family 2 [Bacteroidales bacterium]